jgi:aconitate hydratase
MVKVVKGGVYLASGSLVIEETPGLSRADVDSRLKAAGLPTLGPAASLDSAPGGSMAAAILDAHNVGSPSELRVKFDALASHDITYVGIVQTARASGLKRFPIPYVLTNCHNSLCAVGGTINEDDHVFGLSAAKTYGGIFVPAHQAVIHTYMREEMAACGKMILGSDSHTRYGALGSMAVGEGGPELVKQLLGKTYDLKRPETVLVYLTGAPKPGVGPQDVALAIIAAVFESGFVKNKVMEFAGPGVASLSVDYRCGIDVMTTETTCLSSIWTTDDKVRRFFEIHGRPEAYKPMGPAALARYDGALLVDLGAVEPMIALPFHPSNAFSIDEFNANTLDILRHAEQAGQKAMDNPKIKLDFLSRAPGGRLMADQGVIAGCSGGTFENIMCAADILRGARTGSEEFWLSVYPGSQPVNLELTRNGAAADLIEAGVTMRTAFCGPCFGAGDVPANQGFSIRHTTRNFPNREGSKPDSGQVAAVALMDARSIAATAKNGGRLTPATEVMEREGEYEYRYNRAPYAARVYYGFGKPEAGAQLKFGPNIADWPKMSALTDNLALEIVCVIRDPVTTTDELIPSGETSSYRSNPLKLAEFTLSRKDPGYVGRAKKAQALEKARLGLGGDLSALGDFYRQLERQAGATGLSAANTGVGSLVFANKPGDGSAREQAASCQKVLGGWANVALEYATKRYRSNLVNWGMLPFIVDEAASRLFELGGILFVPAIRKAVEEGAVELPAVLVVGGKKHEIPLRLPGLESGEREIILAGCLINYYSKTL